MRKGTLSIALAACMVALNAGAAMAAEPPQGHEVRVVNRNARMVRVYVQDANGGLHMLGRVAASDFQILKVPAEVTAMGDVQIKVFPIDGFQSLAGGEDGIQTRGINLDGRDAVNLFVENDLGRSLVEIAKG
jgi:hypothetical protein